MVAQISPATGNNSFITAAPGQILAAADPAATAESRALGFLATNGSLVGMSDAERAALAAGRAPAAGSALQLVKSEADSIGMTHVRFDQVYHGVKVAGAQLIVHMNKDGITAVNGDFVSKIALNPVPSLSTEAAKERAVSSITKPGATQKAGKTELAIYPQGLVEGKSVRPVLAYSVEVTSGDEAEQIWIDAQNGALIARIPLHHTALFRRIYSPEYDPENPELFLQRKEGDPPHPTPFVNNLYNFAGQTYFFYRSAFGRDSYDGAGHIMNSVYLINQQCPNAYWNGIATNYCPIFDADDVVSHEWSHAYTEYTHGLIYAYQSGALNESYSDIFGESVDLVNGVDGQGGNNNAKPYPDGQRWLVGEDLGAEVQSLLLRDMYDPDRQGDPGKVSSPNYACGNDDGGGVHTNSGVPNHAYALIVDGTQFKPADPEIGQAAGTYNGQTVTGIGMTKAAAIYFRAEKNYQTPTTTFAQHETAIKTSCSDLIGQPLKVPNTTSATGAAAGSTITAADCQQVAKAMAAVEMSKVPPCNFGPVLQSGAAPLCPGAQAIFSENWENGGEAGAASRGWTKTSMGFGTGTADWEDDRNPPVTGEHTIRNFKLTTALPGGRTGTAAFADDPKIGEPGGGTCAPGTGDYSGSFTLDSPTITIPNGASDPTILNLGSLADPGDMIRIRFTWSQDGCNGVEGWYIDNVRVVTCPLLEPPVLSTGADYQNLDPNGSFTLNWTRPAGATGPDLLQISKTSCAPLIADNAEGGTGKWVIVKDGVFSPQWTSAPPNAKPMYNSSTFWAMPSSEAGFGSTTLTYKDPITIPTGGTTTLSFDQFYFNETGDSGAVEVSTDNGATWKAVYTNTRDMGSLPDTGANAFANEDLTRQDVDLTVYGGKTIRLRFKYTMGDSDFFFFFVTYGWYIDNIVLANDNWQDVASVTGTSFKDFQGSGSYCYRVRSTYTLGGQQVASPFSNIVNVTVAPGIAPVVSRKVHNGIHDIPLPLTGPAGVECRQGPQPGKHQIVFKFAAPATYSSATVTPASGKTAQVESVVKSGNEVAVNLTNVANAQQLTVSLLNANDGSGARNISVPVIILLGDVNATRLVDGNDVSAVQAKTRQQANNTNFRFDVAATGLIDGNDVSATQAKTRTRVP